MNLAEIASAFAVEPFTAADWPTARGMLLAGYPETPARLWDAGFQRLKEVPPGPRDGPLGVLLRQGGAVKGVALLIQRGPGQSQGKAVQVNASSWAIAPDARNRALWMARQSMANPEVVYTALTPITSATRMLQRIGFQAISHQCILGLTPRLCRLPSSGARVLDTHDTLSALADQPIGQALADHHRLGCLVLALDTGDALLPLVFRARRRMRWLPVAELIYTPSQATVAAHVGVIAKYLLSNGYPLLEFEAHEDLVVDFACTRLFQRRFARGPYQHRGIDHLYSELVYLHR